MGVEGTLSGKERIRRFLLDNEGKVVTDYQIVEAAGITSAQRRLRELREEGWPIKSHHNDSSLKPGEYRLSGQPPESGQEKRPRQALSGRIRAQVLERDGYTCQMCGAGPNDLDPRFEGRNIRLQVGHIIHRSQGGGDELTNLRTLCNRCNEGAQDATELPQRLIWLMGHVRKASRDNKRAIYEMLQKEFGE